MAGIAGAAAGLAGWSATAQTAQDAVVPAPGAPVVEQVDPTAAIPLIAPAPPLAGPAYESRIRASFVSAQGFQGVLDGGWRLAGPAGPLYDFQLVDRSGGGVEGAWRDLRRPGALSGSGFVDAVERDGSAVRLRFDGARIATLRPASDGRWIGELEEGGRRLAVSLARREP